MINKQNIDRIGLIGNLNYNVRFLIYIYEKLRDKQIKILNNINNFILYIYINQVFKNR